MLLLTENIMRNYSGFYHGPSGYYVVFMNCDINAYEKNCFAPIFKGLWRENEAFQGQSSYMKIFPNHPLYDVL